MLLFLSILLISLGCICVILSLYFIYCIIGLILFYRKVKDDSELLTETKSLFNILVWIIKKSKKIKEEEGKKYKKKLKALRNTLIGVASSAIIALIRAAFYLITIGIIVYTVDLQFTAVTAVFQSIFSKDSDCPCYALCTGDAEDDKECTYKLLFGENEYNKLISDMKNSLTQQEKTAFDNINAGSSGKEKNQFILEHINDAMVYDYKAIVGSNKSFRKADGLDRTKMSFDEYKADLTKLLQDYKVNGRNPSCECKTCSKLNLKRKCMGMKHYKEGWTWDQLWGNDSSSSDQSSTSGTGVSSGLGKATGQYAIELNDGNWYWYHQSSTLCSGCKYDPVKNLGGSDVRVSTVLFNYYNSSMSENTMGARGCSIYSTAMAMSNVMGEEFTPYDVIEKLLESSFYEYNGRYRFDTTTNLTGAPPSYSYSTMASKINSLYNSRGIYAEVISFTQENVDKYLAGDEWQGLIINSYNNSNCADKNFVWYGGDAHFMVLRAKDSKGYYCLTSCSTKKLTGAGHAGAKKAMTTPLSWDLVYKHKNHDNALVIYKAKPKISVYPLTESVKGDYATRVQQLYKALMDAGFSDTAAAGITANAMSESGINPTLRSKGYYGIFCTKEETFNEQVAKYGITNPNTIEGQAKLLYCVLTGGGSYKGLFSLLQSAETPQEAALYFIVFYERCLVSTALNNYETWEQYSVMANRDRFQSSDFLEENWESLRQITGYSSTYHDKYGMKLSTQQKTKCKFTDTTADTHIKLYYQDLQLRLDRANYVYTMFGGGV